MYVFDLFDNFMAISNLLCISIKIKHFFQFIVNYLLQPTSSTFTAHQGATAHTGLGY